MLDEFYTPPELASEMLNAIPRSFRPRKIADFSAGEGILLMSAAERWSTAKVFANDISPSTARKLAYRKSKWSVSCSNFLCDYSSSRSKYYSQLEKIDLILLNPPFSERGRKLVISIKNTTTFLSGTATAFLYRSLSYLSNNGMLIAILPNSCLTSDRDEYAWSLIKDKYEVEIIRNNHRSMFKGAAASTSIVKIQARSKPRGTLREVSSCSVKNTLDIHRGSLPMYKLYRVKSNQGLPLVHTTNLQQGKITINRNELYSWAKIFKGPGVLFPRVGKLTREKICVSNDKRGLILSDCVIGIPCLSIEAATKLRKLIFENWNQFAASYNGTGAPYITVSKVRVILTKCLAVNNTILLTASSNKLKLLLAA